MIGEIEKKVKDESFSVIEYLRVRDSMEIENRE